MNASPPPERDYLRLAHRGAPREAPENTIASFLAALRHPIDGVEMDIRFTRDDHPVVIHDADLARTGGRPDRVSDLDREGLVGIDVGSWFSPEHAGEPLADLTEALAALDGSTRAFVEVKDGPEPSRTALDRLGAALDERASLNTATLVSFHPSVLEEMRRRLPYLRTGLLLRRSDEVDPVDAAAACGASLLLLPHESVSDEEIGYCARAGYPVIAWTVDEVEEMRRVLDAGAVGIVSNRPELFAELPD